MWAGLRTLGRAPISSYIIHHFFRRSVLAISAVMSFMSPSSDGLTCIHEIPAALIFKFRFDWSWQSGLRQDIEAEAAEDGPGWSFDVDAPRAIPDTGLHRVGAITSIASAPNRKRDPVGGDPAVPAVVRLPFVDDVNI